MAGLLDAFGDENTRFSLGLLAAAGPRFDGANDGQRIQEALQGMDAYKQRQTQAQMQKMQMEQMQSQIAKQKRMEELAKRYATPATPATQGPQVPLNMPGDTGPNLYSPNVSNMSTSGMQPAKPAGFDYQGYAQEMASIDPMEAMKWAQMLQKDDAPVKLGAGEMLLSGKASGYKPLYTAPAKPEGKPTKVQEYEYAKANGYKGTLEQYVSIGPALMAAAQAPLRQAQTDNIYQENAYNLPPPIKPKGAPVSVSAGGKTYTFPDQRSANSFKMKAGIK